MAATSSMSFIRYRYKSEKDFRCFLCDGRDCSVAHLKKVLNGKSSKPTLRRSKDEIVLTITDESTNKEYQDDHDLIPSNTSVIVERRLREIFQPLTPETVRYQPILFDDVIDQNLQPGLQSRTSTNRVSGKNTLEKPTTELECIKHIQQSIYYTSKPTSYICHYCNQYGHMKRHCPLLIENSTAKIRQTINSTHKSMTFNVNNTNIKKSLSNKFETSLDTPQVMPAPFPSAFCSSNIFPQHSSPKIIIDLRSDNEDDAVLIQTAPGKVLASPSHMASRYSPYQLQNGQCHRLRMSHTSPGISRNNFTGMPRDKLNN
ncbi:unnamed protein product [Rotaria socialis]|uniref:CCHC-type domain-containing protein n=2 Tax=Rotaria socialis TaxID=392032 RepID=A0A817REW0_9BILA|nr:unnamed protein product [Rotaria socialis]CAF3339584.1 unnamed protein product [Rotaria socialis]CAF3348215.1 unnamed protein product [Rotaria socialis]CAF4309866.1 unnamed protein product [Rotaria socialis]CAF4467123.1 unnamed protein product [Rotaria socialis]